MGSCMSFQISCDQTLNHVCSCLCGDGNYIKKLPQNLNALQVALEELVAMREDLSKSVSLEERKGLQRLAQVQLWLSRSESLEHKVNGLISSRNIETGRLCMNGCCSKNFLSSYVYGKKVFKMLKDLKELNSHEGFNVVAQIINESVDYQRPTKPTVGFDRMLDEAWNLFMREEVGTFGIYGMGGVGKTTLLTQVNNKFAKQTYGFDIVIWVTVSRDGQVSRIQEEIKKHLFIHNEGWLEKQEEEKASDIHKILKRKKFVLLLDDVWSEIDLQKIGVPYPNRENNCKIAFTARSMMRADAEMEVKCLEPDDAWNLFRKQVGDTTLNFHEDIPQLARAMAARCQGLPLALTVIGGAMSCKRTVHEWQHAMDYFTSPQQSRFPGMADRILPILRFSYDDLEDETAKRCFEYCALFPEDYEIEKEALIEYWIGEGFIQGGRSRDSALNHGYMIIGKLVRACLLINDESKGIVKMHDIVREMALTIACSSPFNAFNFIVKTGNSLRCLPYYSENEWMKVGRMSLMGNQIHQKGSCSSKFPELTTLFLQNNDLLEFSSHFFRSMPKLMVLDLSRNYNLGELPDMSKLISLRHLDLSHTEIKKLPFGLEMLQMLIHLNLEFTMELQDIRGLSSLKKLQVLRLLGSRCSFSNALIEIRDLENLQLLTTSINDGWEAMHCNLARYIQDLSITMLDLPLLTIQVSHNLRYFEIRDSNISEICIEMGKEKFLELPVFSLESSCFSKLSRVEIINCRSLRHLTWLMFAPKLTRLRVVRSRLIEEIICQEETSNEQSEEMPFLRLQLLHLQDLGELKGVHWSHLLFPCLTKVVIFGCPKLKKLPLYSESAKGQNLVIEAEKEWFTQLEWEDEATKQRFYPTSL